MISITEYVPSFFFGKSGLLYELRAYTKILSFYLIFLEMYWVYILYFPVPFSCAQVMYIFILVLNFLDIVFFLIMKKERDQFFS